HPQPRQFTNLRWDFFQAQIAEVEPVEVAFPDVGDPLSGFSKGFAGRHRSSTPVLLSRLRSPARLVVLWASLLEARAINRGVMVQFYPPAKARATACDWPAGP